jgi:peroxiredoxin Q/BCP
VLEARKDLEKLGVAALGISRDAPPTQKKFKEKEGLDYPLLSDPDAAVATAYGVWGEKTMYGKKVMGITRSSFLLDGEGKILGVWYGLKPEETAPKAMEVLVPEGS